MFVFTLALLRIAMLAFRGQVNPVSDVFLVPDSDGWVYPAVLDDASQKRPVAPSDIRFYLWTRQNPVLAWELKTGNVELLKRSTYSPNKDTKIFIHGFSQTALSDFVVRAREAYLARGDYNIISVDWRRLARSPYYSSAASNTREVGMVTARFIDFLVSQGSSLSNFHVIGYSLGAHAAGQAGNALTSGKLPRITGLDPALPGFEKPERQDDRRRLNRSDAQFVDVIHTNSRFGRNKGLSIPTPLGHADFYPNGGFTQPGCNRFFGIELPIEGCSHSRASHYYIESIRKTGAFLSIRCSDYLSFIRGQCGDCASNPSQCVPMGDGDPPGTYGTYYLATKKYPPYSLS